MLIDFSRCKEIIRACHGAGVKSVLHVGAHTGEEALPYSAGGVEKILWVEANSALAPILKRNIAQYAMQQAIISCALWDKNEILTFHVTNNFQSSSFFELQTHATHYPDIVVTEEKQIQAFRLDALIDAEPSHVPFTDFDFVNIDTQGAELAVLKGMGRYIDQPSIKGIYLEVNREPLYKGIPLIAELDEFLAAADFHRIATAWTRAGWGDALYVKAITEDW
jgi:FkbM family methyltransferase